MASGRSIVDLQTSGDDERRLARLADRAASARRSQHLAPDCGGLNFYDIDHGLRDLLPLYMDPALLDHLRPHLSRLGEVAGGTLNDLAEAADKNPPRLHARDRYGRDEEWIEFHPAYRGMEQIAFGDFALHALTHRPALGWPEPMPPVAKTALHYLFAQAEFGLMCPINLTDSSSDLIARYGDEAVKARFLPGMWSQDLTRLLRGAQFMTEKAGGSDVGANELVAVRDGEAWRLYGEKWFCSNADAEVAVLLARPEGAPAGGKGLGLFVMPKTLDDGSRNAYRVVRLKDKLGSKSMASGEIVFDGALAWPLGALDAGLKQMLEMVNSSRLSHATRAAGMMRRCLNEAFQAARRRSAFGTAVIDHPLMRRQLLKLMVPTEQALSTILYLSAVAARKGERETRKILRLMTPLAKYRTCRDNVAVATGAMEARGGNGYIEDFVNARLVRDAHLGVIWEGTSNISALDAIRRAVGKEKAHVELQADVERRLAEASALPGQFRTRLQGAVAQAFRFAEQVAAAPERERFSRQASAALYHGVSAALLAAEGTRLGEQGGDARRLLLARFVLEHRLGERKPMNLDGQAWEDEAIDLLLDEAPVPLARAEALAVG
jgi:acyl-CoA dehydrogenase